MLLILVCGGEGLNGGMVAVLFCCCGAFDYFAGVGVVRVVADYGIGDHDVGGSSVLMWLAAVEVAVSVLFCRCGAVDYFAGVGVVGSRCRLWDW